jgi:proteasome assembly chaperone (PAC2) family protein
MKLKEPWLLSVWPGMGQVAMSAGYYLMAKLGMQRLGEFEARELFDVEHVVVKDGIVRAGELPRSRLYAWRDPAGRHDLVLFIGEAQPPRGRYEFCHRLVERAKEMGVERVFTFAAMATTMHPEHTPRVYVAATDAAELRALAGRGLTVLEDGQIAGLNGVLLGAAVEAGLSGACLLGEMPHIFSQLPFPRASLAVLRVFAAEAGLALDFTELLEEAQRMDRHLGEILARVERAMGSRAPEAAEPEAESFQPEPEEEGGLGREDAAHLEQLFEQAARDRSKAYELKTELDRLGVFREYEDRFLDLFQ